MSPGPHAPAWCLPSGWPACSRIAVRARVHPPRVVSTWTTRSGRRPPSRRIRRAPSKGQREWWSSKTAATRIRAWVWAFVWRRCEATLNTPTGHNPRYRCLSYSPASPVGGEISVKVSSRSRLIKTKRTCGHRLPIACRLLRHCARLSRARLSGVTPTLGVTGSNPSRLSVTLLECGSRTMNGIVSVAPTLVNVMTLRFPS